MIGTVFLASLPANADTLRQVRYSVSLNDILKPSETLFLCDQTKALEVKDHDRLYLLVPGEDKSRDWVFEGRVVNKVIQLSIYDDFPYTKEEIASLQDAIEQCPSSHNQTLANIGISLGQHAFNKTALNGASTTSDPIVTKVTQLIRASTQSVPDYTTRIILLERMMKTQFKMHDLNGARLSAIAGSEIVPSDIDAVILKRFFTLAAKAGVTDSGKRVSDNTTPPVRQTADDIYRLNKRPEKYGASTDVGRFTEAAQTPDYQKAKTAQQAQESGDISGALSTAQTIQDKRMKDRVVADIAVTQVKDFSDFENAVSAANRINDAIIRTVTLIDILEAKTNQL